MFHLRKKGSTSSNPVTWCGKMPEFEMLGHYGPQVIQEQVIEVSAEGVEFVAGIRNIPAHCNFLPMMTEYDWVKPVAKGHPNICQECVTAIENPTFDDTVPF